MKRYAVMHIRHYYPEGGFGDLVDTFESRRAAVNYAERLESIDVCGDTAEVWDTETRKPQMILRLTRPDATAKLSQVYPNEERE